MEDGQAVLWKVFSNVVKPEKTICLEGSRNDPKAVYNFHESIINALRPTLREGIRSIIVVSSMRTNHAQKFIDHIHSHHIWLVQGPNKAILSEATGSAGTLSEVAAMTRTSVFHQLICETTSEETESLVDILEKHLHASNQETLVLFSLEETENLIFGPLKPGRPKPEYLMLTDEYLSDSCEKNRLHRLMQIAKNRSIKTRIVGAESTAGLRLAQLGGMVCLCAS